MNREQKKCKKCGIIFERPKRLTGSFRISQKQWEKKLYCSCSCAQKDKKVSIITKKRISEKHKKLEHHSGRFQKGHRTNIDKKRSRKIRQEISERMKNKKRPELAGENNPNWRGGITSENDRIRKSIETRLWRESVFARDGYICQKCDKKGEMLRCHHIQNFADYPELRTSIENGITFCKKCHREFHSIYGNKNTNKEQIKEFLLKK